VVDYSAHSTEPAGSIIWVKFLEKLRNCYLIKKGCAMQLCLEAS